MPDQVGPPKDGQATTPILYPPLKDGCDAMSKAQMSFPNVFIGNPGMLVKSWNSSPAPFSYEEKGKSNPSLFKRGI